MKQKTALKRPRKLLIVPLAIICILLLTVIAQKSFNKFIELERKKVAHQWHLEKTKKEIPSKNTEEPRDFPNATADYEGVGVLFEKQEQSFYIAEVIIGSPADKAGVKIGDRIISVDGKYVLGLDKYEVSELLKGESDTKATMDIYRDSFGENSQKFEIVRAPIDLSANRAFHEFYATGKGGKDLGNNYIAYNNLVFYADPNSQTYGTDPHVSKKRLTMEADGLITFSGNDCWQKNKLNPRKRNVCLPPNQDGLKEELNYETCINFAKNKNKVFRNAKELQGADPASFELLEERNEVKYSKDKNHVYYINQIIAGADPASFEIISREYTKDKNHVYYLADQLEDADPASFEVVSKIYGKDKNNVYLEQYKVRGADPETFEVTKKERVAKDANAYYLGARKVDYKEFIEELNKEEDFIH